MDARARKVRRRRIRKTKSRARGRVPRRRCPGAAAGFGRSQFGAARLGDKRRTDRLVRAADLIMSHPGGTLPHKLKDPADLQGVYRLANADAVTHAAVIAPHCAATRLTMAGHGGVVLLVHDTTELDYSGLKATGGLGPIGNGGCRGYLCHNSLAVDAATGAVLGLANQVLHTRRKVPRGETAAQRRDHPHRESRLWKTGCEACALPAGSATTVIDVCDAGADAFELFDYEHSAGRRFVIRAGKDRVLGGQSREGADQVKDKLYAFTRGLADLGGRYVRVRTNRTKRQGRWVQVQGRLARCRLTAGGVTLPVPQKPRGEHGHEPLKLWVVHVREQDPPAGQQPLEWVLLTNVPADTLEQAARCVEWYARRPVVEEYHKAQKTGCGIEQLQFSTKAALEPLIALLSVVAVTLLQLREADRLPDAKDTPAASRIPPSYVRVLSAWRTGRPDPHMSLHDFFMALARLGGHQNRKSDGPPGWMTLWRGWNDLHLMVLGARAARRRCDET